MPESSRQLASESLRWLSRVTATSCASCSRGDAPVCVSDEASMLRDDADCFKGLRKVHITLCASNGCETLYEVVGGVATE